MTLDRYMDDFGADLARAARARVRRRRRLRLALALPGAAALAVAASTLPGTGSVDGVAAAREALAPANEIVHMKVQTRLGKDAIGPTTEQWYAGDPTRWRSVSSFNALRRRAAPALEMAEIAYFNDRIRIYDKHRDVVTILNGPTALKPMGPSVLGGDPSTDVRAMLAAGDVRDDGVVTVDGRSVRRLVSDQTDFGPRRRLVYYMDPQTFAPLGGRVYFDSERRVPTLEFTVEVYERLPLNAETQRLLRFEETPSTKHVWRRLGTTR
jgi:hypothetical protein